MTQNGTTADRVDQPHFELRAAPFAFRWTQRVLRWPALVRGDSIVWKVAFGYANMRTHTPATTVTFTHILSHWPGLIAGAVTELIWSRRLPKTLEAMTSSLYSIRAPETKWEYNTFAYGGG